MPSAMVRGAAVRAERRMAVLECIMMIEQRLLEIVNAIFWFWN